MRDGPTFTTCCGALAALLVIAGCQNLHQLRAGPINRSGSPIISDWESKYVCWRALERERIAWDHSYPQEVAEAKNRGLSEQQCARLSGRFTQAQLELRFANSGPSKEVIVQAQAHLKRLGHLNGRLDSTPGQKTIAAVKSFQKSQNEPQTGQINGNLLASLRQVIRERINTVKGRDKPLSEGYTKQDLGHLPIAVICRQALQVHHPKWDSRRASLHWVEEAKRRGFTEDQCARLSRRSQPGMFQKVFKAEPPSPTLRVSSLGWLCGLAIKADAPFWDRSNSSLAEYITEAKRKGLSEQQCARETGRFTESQIALASPPPPKLIKSTQRLLIDLGHLNGSADGIAGRKTVAAVISFQKSQNEPQTGEISDSLVTSLKKADRERVQTAKVDVAKSLAQLREERRKEEARLADLKIQTQERENNLAKLSLPRPAQSAIPTNINFGDYHALVIGINNYRNLPKLRTAVADAEAIGEVLKTRYGFSVTTLIDPTREDIFEKLDGLRAQLKFTDNLLIYYAGHGWLDQAGNEGYWQPANARADQQAGWVSNASITTNLRAIKAKHVMVMADSCYSGKLVRGSKAQTRGIELASINAEASSYLQKMARRKTRVAMTSGNLEPVQDGDNKHSPFARAILQALNENERVIDGIRLFNAILQPVVANTDQTPQYAPIRNAGHSNGSFLFVRRK